MTIPIQVSDELARDAARRGLDVAAHVDQLIQEASAQQFLPPLPRLTKDELAECDTNVRLRTSRLPEHAIILRAVELLRQSGGNPCATPQVIAKYWNVSTCPLDRNGFGLMIDQVALEVQQLERFLTILPETLEVFEEGKRLVTTHEVRGVQGHDARLAANMRVHGVSNLLTLNGADFHHPPAQLA